MTRREGRTKTPQGPNDPDDGATYEVPTSGDYRTYAAPGEGSRSAFFARRDELDVIARMLARHYGVDRGRAHAIVWGQPGLLGELINQKGRPPKPHLVQAADVADETLSSGREMRWDVVHRCVVALNDREESRAFEYEGEQSSEPRDSEDWQRAVRRIRSRLRAKADALARQHGLTSHPGNESQRRA